LSAHAIKNEETDVALQAIEIWNTICDEEIDIMETIAEAPENEEASRKNLKFVEQALPQLTPLILECLTKQEEEEDDDDNLNIASAGGACLNLLAQATADTIVPLVLPFVQQNINNPSWRLREAAIISFGCILSGPDPQKLGPTVHEALPVLIYHLKDQSHHVKDTAAWTIGRICEYVPETTEHCLQQLMTALLESLNDVAKVASNVCWAIHNLALATQVEPEDTSSPLSPYFNALITRLLQITYRSDADQGNLMVGAYEAINALIRTAASDMYETIGNLIPALINQHKQVGTGDSDKHHKIQALLCSALQVIIQRLPDAAIIPHGNELMILFLQVLKMQDAITHEEAFRAVGTLASKMGGKFEEYMRHFLPVLIFGLKNSSAFTTCIAAVGVVSDLARALEARLFPYCDQIMQSLLEDLRDPNVERSVKPHIISVFADVAMSIEGNFDRYLTFVMGMLVQASRLNLDCSDADNLEYLTTLREAVLEAYTGILHGLMADNKQELFKQWINDVVSFIVLVSNDKYREPVVTRAACGVVGDIGRALGVQAAQMLMHPNISNNLLQAAIGDSDENTKQAGEYAQKELQTLAGSG